MPAARNENFILSCYLKSLLIPELIQKDEQMLMVLMSLTNDAGYLR